jgi:hypothetical protein
VTEVDATEVNPSLRELRIAELKLTASEARTRAQRLLEKANQLDRVREKLEKWNERTE